MNPAPAATAASPPWRRRIAWLLFLAPFFFLSYGYANHVAAGRGVADAVFFAWERNIPFVPWTILPYWSIDLFYGLSFLLCRDRRQVDRHGLRLLTAQLIAVACFLAFPLRFAFPRPRADGAFGALFGALAGFDLPFNQAPSLHIALLVILWTRFAAAAPRPWRAVVHIWATLIGVSVLTTYQHHFIDVPTGALVGLLCLWVWPEFGAPPLSGGLPAASARHRRIAAAYLLGALALGGAAAGIGGAALWLLWGAAALGLVALIYLRSGADGFQKRDGRHSLAVRLLLAPYLLGAWLNSRWWTRRRPAPDAILDGVWLGRMPGRREMEDGGFAALCDFTAELPAPRGKWHYTGQAWLDLVPPDAAQLRAAARLIESSRAWGPVLVCCALGYGRGASAVLAWLLGTGRAADLAAAEAMVRAQRPRLALSPAHRAALAEFAAAGAIDSPLAPR